MNLLNKLGFVWEVDRATSRQLKGDVLKTNDTNECAFFSSSATIDPSKQARHIILSGRAVSDNLRQGDTLAGCCIQSSAQELIVSTDSEGSGLVKLVKEKEAATPSSMSRSAQDVVLTTRLKDPPGASAANTDYGDEAAGGSDDTDPHAIEKDPCPTRGGANVKPASKRCRYSVEKPRDDAHV